MATGNKAIRQARQFLFKRGIKTKDLTPKALAETADENNISFLASLKMLIDLVKQDKGPSPVAEKFAEAEGKKK